MPEPVRDGQPPGRVASLMERLAEVNLAARAGSEGNIPLLVNSLSDASRRVQRAAARGLRRWLRSRRELTREILPHYAGTTFDGSYSHCGLYDMANDRVWIPRYASMKGHAALLRDGNTDEFFKFEFYRPWQAPRHLVRENDSVERGHLVLHFILDWRYAGQTLAEPEDDSVLREDREEQGCYGSSVTSYYRECALPYPITVHHLLMRGGHQAEYVRNTDTIAGHS